MENFINIRFPVDISYGSSGGPEYNTDLIITTTGYEHRYDQWSKPRLRFNVAGGIKNRSQIAELLSFFHLCKGRFYGFKYKDWSDFRLQKEPLKPLGNNAYRIVKNYNFQDKLINVREITQPVVETIKLYDGLKQLNIEEFKFDANKSVIILDQHTTNDIKITCDFDIPARFDVDYLPITLESYNSFFMPEIPIIEIKN
jgi:uncharacterized protein (TIGR02217 family)